MTYIDLMSAKYDITKGKTVDAEIVNWSNTMCKEHKSKELCRFSRSQTALEQCTSGTAQACFDAATIARSTSEKTFHYKQACLLGHQPSCSAHGLLLSEQIEQKNDRRIAEAKAEALRQQRLQADRARREAVQQAIGTLGHSLTTSVPVPPKRRTRCESRQTSYGTIQEDCTSY